MTENLYDYLQTRQTKDSSIRSNFYLNKNINPDQAANDFKVSKITGLSQNLVSQQRPETYSRAELNEALPHLYKSEALSNFIIDRHNAAMSKDDIAQLAKVSGMGEWERAGFNIKEGAKQVAQNFFGFIRGFAKASAAAGQKPSKFITDFRESIAAPNFLVDFDVEMTEYFKDKVAPAIADWAVEMEKSEVLRLENLPRRSGFAGYWDDVVKMAPQIVAQIAAAKITGPVGAMSFMGSQITGGKYKELVDVQGVDPERAFTAGVADAILQAPLEQIGLSKALKAWRPTKLFSSGVKEVVQATGTEFLTELIQKYPEAITEIWGRAKVEGHTLQDQATLFYKQLGTITAQGVYEGLVAAPFGGLTSTTGVAFKSYADKKTQAKNIENFRDDQIKANDQINDTKLKGRSSEKMEEFLDLNGYDEDTFVSAEGMEILFQLDKEMLAEKGITEKEIDEIKASGTNTALKLSVLHSKLSSEDFKQIVDHLSPDGKAPTMAEIKQAKEVFATSAEAYVKQVEAQKQEEAKIEEERKEIYEDVKERRTALGRVLKTASSDAEYWASFAVAYADRHGYSPMQVYESLVPEMKSGKFKDSPEFKKIQDLKDKGATLKQVEKNDPLSKLAEDFNTETPGLDIRYDGEMDLSALGKPNMYQFTAYSGDIKGATFIVKEATAKALSQRIKEMQEAWKPKKTLYQKKIKGAYDPETDVLSLFELADESTFLHESGHVFFEFLSTTANAEGAPLSLKEDWAAIAKHVGNDGTKPLTREQHELLAETLERYFREGKAPSTRLRRVFQRFAAWLRQLYTQADKLGVEITDDLRASLNRMFATEREIREVQEYYDAQKPFLSDLKAEEEKKYNQLRKRAELDAESKRLKKYIDAYLAAIGGEKQLYKEASETVNSMPVYKAMDTAIDEGGMPLELIDYMVGDETRKLLTKKRVGLVTKKGTLDPDFLARENGYDSAEEMLTAMVEAEKKKDVREKIVISKLGKIQRDMMDQLESDIPAEEDYHSESRMKVLAAELQTIRQQEALEKGRVKARVTRLKTQAIKDVAKEALTSRTVREASNFNKYSRAEAKAAKLARNAYEKGDLESAEKYKRQELLNHALVIESIAIRDEMNKGADKVKKHLKSKAIHQEAFDLINDIAIRFGFKNRPAGTNHEQAVELYRAYIGELDNKGNPRKTINYEAWEQDQTEKGYGVSLSWIVKDKATATFYKDLRVDSFRAVMDSVNQIYTNDLNDRKILFEGKKVDLDKVVDRLITTLSKNYDPKTQKIFEKNKKNFLSSTDAWLAKMEFLFEAMDGKKLGPFHQTLFQRLAKAEELENLRINEANKAIKEIFDKHYTKKEQKALFSKKARLIPEIGEAPTKAQLIRTFLDFGNRDNYEKRRDGNGWSDEQMTAVKNNLDRKDFDFCQDIWDYIGSFKDEAFALEKRMTGRAPEAVMPEQVETPFGVLKGGYFPISFDPTKSTIALARQQIESSKLYGTKNFGHAMTKKGHLKERKATAGGQMLSLELSDITNHVAGVLHDITHREAVVDVSKIFTDKRMDAAFRQYLGDDMAAQFTPWLKDIANPMPAMTVWERAAKGIRMGLNVAKLGKFSVMGQQLAGFTQSIHALGESAGRAKASGLLIKEFNHMVFGPRNMADMAFEKSNFMKTRMTSYDREARDAFRGLKVAKKLTDKFGEFAMKGIGVLQFMVDLPTWSASYKHYVESGFSEAEAVAYADNVVRTSQGAGAAKDLARVQRGSEIVKPLFMFYSFMNMAYNIFTKTGRGKKFDFKEMTSALLFVGFIGPIAAELLSGRPPDDEKDETLAGWVAKTEFRFFSGMFPIFRDVAGSAASGFGYRLSPVEQPVETVIKGVRRAVKEEDPTELVKPAAEIGGIALKLPSDQMFKTSEAFWHWVTGDPNFEFQHLIYGGKYED